MQTRFYRHYKNKPYKYLGLVHHSETLEELVLYETLYENEIGRTWVRPKKIFFEKIEKNNQQISRFEPIVFEFKNSEFCSPSDIAIIKDISHKTFGILDETKLSSRIGTQSLLLQIAFENEKPVGFKLGYALDQDVFYSWMGAVLPEYQGLGVGSVLMENQHEWCLKKRFKKIQTKSKNEFKQMIRLNLAFGFEIIGVESCPKNQIKILFEKNLN